ncbi:PREDICTED: interferon omega-2-like [Ceratotherium simum simum]|uniref:Interferon omega-2-like n=1 Tax=Ceratotherium simum simum TaxID=73337 RepID=A0ABM1D7T1_CERSS|nr:PREDICTED: interferon omega-2-like [Ceratotherium simum simum]
MALPFSFLTALVVLSCHSICSLGFPKALAIPVLHEMLQQIFNLFHTERSSAAWNTTLLDKICSGLHQVLEDLDTCLTQKMDKTEDTPLGRKNLTLEEKRYFQEIHLDLKEKR